MPPNSMGWWSSVVFDLPHPVLEGQSNEIFCLGLFYEWVSSKLLTLFLKAFRIWLRIRGNIRDFLLTLRYYL
jgi:hypothetical protein